MEPKKCFALIRFIRWGERVTCPKCGSHHVIKRGFDDTQGDRQRYQCKQCQSRFDDLTDTIFAGHHQPLGVWILFKGKPGRGTLDQEKPPVFGMIHRSGEVIIKMLDNVQQVTIKPLIQKAVALGTLVYTDEYAIYQRLDQWGYEHKSVCHGSGEYARMASLRTYGFEE